MLEEDKYFKTLSEPEIWNRYCGFFDLSIEEFMDIQKKLLTEEIELVADSILGKKIMGDEKPKSIDEFREIVPLTTYDDYEPYLSEKQEEALAVKPYLWCHSSGQGGRFKWVPHSREAIEKAVRSYLAGAILGSCRKKGEVRVAPGLRIFAVLAPPPYSSGENFRALTQRFTTRMMPPLEPAEDETFQERIQQGFKTALRDGMDYIGSLASVLVRLGEAFTEQPGGMKLSRSLMHPAILSRLLRAFIRAKLANRPMLPKDIWQPKGILVSGVDASIYNASAAYYWGVEPLELYGGSEGLSYALQCWNRKGMTLHPDSVFWEFLPYENEQESGDGKTLLFDELEEGKTYEVIMTQFHGMPLLRYRLNDIIKITCMKDEEAGINLPQIAFHRRVGEVINLGGLVWLDEKTIWQACYNTGIGFTEWTACKEYEDDKTYLRLYLELKEEHDVKEMEKLIDEQLNSIDTNYWELHETLNLNPVRVTLLSSGTFQRYTEEKTEQGADLAHLKPAHVNPPESEVQRLLYFNEIKEV